MPHASHRLDLLALPSDLNSAPDESAFAALSLRWSLDARGKSGDSAALVEGGCRRVWFDRPGRLMLYANQTGGFRARCPANSAIVSSEFGRAHRAWKAGGPRTMACVCGAEHALEHVVLQPAGAFAQWAVVFSSAEGLGLTDRAMGDLVELFGPIRTIVRRP